MADPFLALPGAVADPALGVPMHFGAPLREQRELEAGSAVVDLSHRGVVVVTGPDRLRWLSSMLSQRLDAMPVGAAAEALLLDPNGRIEHVIRFVDDGERSWLLVDEAEAEGLAEFLTRMRFALRVSVADVSAEYAVVLAFPGGPALPHLREIVTPRAEWADPWGDVVTGGVQYARGAHPGAEWAARQLVIDRRDLAMIAEAAASGAIGVAGLLALDALEVRAARPTFHGEVDARAIPHEFDWLRTAVHLNKGCYRGQETVAKVHNLGHPPRRLALLHLDGSEGELPRAGALVHLAGATDSGRPVGRVTRAALHHEWGPIALALLKRSTPEDAELAVRIGDPAPDPATAWVAAAQEVIVPADAGATRRADIAAHFSRRS